MSRKTEGADVVEKRPRSITPIKVVGEKPPISTVTVTVRGRDADGAKSGLRYVVHGKTYQAVLDRIEDALNDEDKAGT